MPKLTLDGKEIEVAAGTTILEAALSRGREVPHFCYHPGLSIAGNCRICLVEVEKAPKLVIACMMPVQDGMVVHTDSEKVQDAQKAVMEFLLINHPLDCPICDQAGECKLQDHAVEYGPGKSRYTEPKQALAKAVDIGKHVMLDQERCIHCSRCVRFCDEVTKTGELAFFQRGHQTLLATYPGKRLDNPYSGNVVDICPVGALTLKEFRFKTRVWYLKNTPSICAGCARGCNVMVSTGRQTELMTTLGQQDDRIKRLVPRVNMDVNGHWMCDEGRLSYQPAAHSPRLEQVVCAGDQPDSWDAAVAELAKRLRHDARQGRVAVVASPRLPSETLYAWKKLGAALGDVKIGVRRLERGEDDEILIRADKGGNSQGAAWIFGADATAEALLRGAAAGEFDTLVVLGDPLDPADTVELTNDMRKKLRHVFYVGPFRDAACEAADVKLPAAAWGEEDGTLVNFEGRVQRARRARRAPGESRPGWRLVADLAAAAELVWPAWGSADDALATLSAEVPAFDGLDAQTIGLLGVPRAQTAPAGA